MEIAVREQRHSRRRLANCGCHVIVDRMNQFLCVMCNREPNRLRAQRRRRIRSKPAAARRRVATLGLREDLGLDPLMI